jgi:DNA-binding CsgD family transcriptional regulator/PAS domain-containing protein
MGNEELSELVGLIYDAALDPDAWPVMLSRLADALSAQCGFIGSHNSSTNTTAITAPRTDPEYLRSFIEYWARRAFIWNGGEKLPVGTVIVRDMIISRDEFCRTDYYNEWCKPQGVEATIATNLLVKGPLSTVIAVSRPYLEGDFDATETRFFAEIIPHLQRALQLKMRLAGLNGLPECSAQILNRLSQGVLLVDAEARVIFANRAAEDLLRTGHGLFVGCDGLRAEIASETRRLRRIIADCAELRPGLGSAGGHLRLTRERDIPLTVLVAPHRSRFGWIDIARPRAIVFVTDPEATADVRRQWLHEDFGLTPAETMVAVEILKADGLQMVARRLRISLPTAHTHLAHIFDKTGTHRQSELVRVLLQSQPAIREG